MTLLTALLVALGLFTGPTVTNYERAPDLAVEIPNEKDLDMAWWHNCP